MGKKKLKTTKKLIAEECEVYQNTNLLLLKGCEGLCRHYEKHRKFNPCFSCSCNEFSCAFKEDEEFYFKFVHYREQEPFYTEVGLGSIIKSNDLTFLERKKIIFSVVRGEVLPHPSAYTTPTVDESRDYLEVTPHYITNPFELMQDGNVVVCTDEEATPTQVIIEDNSLLGRLNDSIQSVSINDVFIQILECFLSYKKSINLKCHKLFSSVLNCNSLVLSLKKKTQKPPMGSIIWDSDDKLLKFYNGKEWKVILTGEDKIE